MPFGNIGVTGLILILLIALIIFGPSKEAADRTGSFFIHSLSFFHFILSDIYLLPIHPD